MLSILDVVVIGRGHFDGVAVVQDVVAVGIRVVRRDEQFVLVVDVSIASVGDKVLVADLVMELSVGSHLVSVGVVV